MTINQLTKQDSKNLEFGDSLTGHYKANDKTYVDCQSCGKKGKQQKCHLQYLQSGYRFTYCYACNDKQYASDLIDTDYTQHVNCKQTQSVKKITGEFSSKKLKPVNDYHLQIGKLYFGTDQDGEETIGQIRIKEQRKDKTVYAIQKIDDKIYKSWNGQSQDKTLPYSLYKSTQDKNIKTVFIVEGYHISEIFNRLNTNKQHHAISLLSGSNSKLNKITIDIINKHGYDIVILPDLDKYKDGKNSGLEFAKYLYTTLTKQGIDTTISMFYRKENGKAVKRGSGYDLVDWVSENSITNIDIDKLLTDDTKTVLRYCNFVRIQSEKNKRLKLIKTQTESDKQSYDLEFDREYISDNQELLSKVKDGQNVLIQSATGTGKTELVKQIDNIITELYPNKQVIFASHLRTLIDQSAKRLNFTHQTEADGNEPRIATTLKSLLRFKLYQDTILIIDEASYTIRQIFQPGGIYKHLEKIEILKSITESGCQIILLDNHFSSYDIDLYKELKKDIYTVKNTYLKREKKAYTYTTDISFIDSIKTSIDNQDTNKFTALYVSNKKKGKQYKVLFQKQGYKVIFINSENSHVDNSVCSDVIRDNKVLQDYDLVIYTSTLGRGFDYNHEYCKNVFAIDNRYEPIETLQACDRFRKANTIHLLLQDCKQKTFRSKQDKCTENYFKLIGKLDIHAKDKDNYLFLFDNLNLFCDYQNAIDQESINKQNNLRKAWQHALLLNNITLQNEFTFIDDTENKVNTNLFMQINNIVKIENIEYELNNRKRLLKNTEEFNQYKYNKDKINFSTDNDQYDHGIKTELLYCKGIVRKEHFDLSKKKSKRNSMYKQNTLMFDTEVKDIIGLPSDTNRLVDKKAFLIDMLENIYQVENIDLANLENICTIKINRDEQLQRFIEFIRAYGIENLKALFPTHERLNKLEQYIVDLQSQDNKMIIRAKKNIGMTLSKILSTVGMRFKKVNDGKKLDIERYKHFKIVYYTEYTENNLANIDTITLKLYYTNYILSVMDNRNKGLRQLLRSKQSSTDYIKSFFETTTIKQAV